MQRRDNGNEIGRESVAAEAAAAATTRREYNAAAAAASRNKQQKAVGRPKPDRVFYYAHTG